MSLVKYIRELEHQDAQEVNEIAFDDGTNKAKKTTMNKLPVSFKNLIDTPPNMATEAGKHVEVNPQGTGLVYVPAPASAYTEKCSNNTDIIVSTGTTLGGWKDICTLTLAKDIDIHKARFFYSLRCREVGNQTGTLRVGIKLNGFSPTTFQEFHITDDMNAVISNFLINDSAYSAGDTVTLSVAGVGDHVGFDLSIKGTVEPSYFEVTVQQVAGVGASIASTTITDTTNFNGILSSADDNVQKALDTIDDSKNEDGWKQVSLPATFGSTTDGVDTINFAADVSDIFEKSMPVRVVSDSGDLTFYCSAVTTNIIRLNGEVSVSGTITAIYLSREYKPKGLKNWEEEFQALAHLNVLQTIPSTTSSSTVVNLYTITAGGFDPNGDYNNISHAHEYIIPVTGKFSFTLKQTCKHNTDGFTLGLFSNDIMIYEKLSGEGISGYYSSSTEGIIEAVRSDKIVFKTKQSSGAGVDLLSGLYTNMYIRFKSL